MQKYFSVTNNQRKWLLAVTLLAFSFLLMNLASIVIEAYNKEVQSAELRKRTDAEGELPFTISGSHYPPAPFGSVGNRLINFIIIPASFLLLLGKRFWRFLLSTVLISLSFSHFALWIYGTLDFHFFNAKEFNESFPNGTKLLLSDSNIFDVLLLACIIVLFIWQVKILLRNVSLFCQSKPTLP